VIGFAYPVSITENVRVIRDEIAASQDPRSRAITIAVDSSTQGDPPDVEVQRAEHLAAIPGIVGIVGHGGSRGSLAAAPVYNQAGIPQIVPTSTSRLLRDAGPWTFQLPPDDSVEGTFMARFAVERLHARRVTLFYINDEYGIGLRDGVTTELHARGVVVLDRVAFDTKSDLATLVAAALQAGPPDVVIVAGRQHETGHIARAVWRRRPGTRILAGDGALVLPAVADDAGPAADSIYVVAFWLADATDSLSRAFIARFRRLNGGTPQSAAAMNHDALMLLVRAIREVGPDRRAVRDYLRSLGGSRPPYLGITGPITFAAARSPRLVMGRLTRGTVVRVEPP